MNQIEIQYCRTPIGELILGSYDGQLCLLDYRDRKGRATVDRRLCKGLNAEFVERESAVIRQTRAQLDEYLSSDRQTFDIPLLLAGTDFQKQVWRALMQIPYGATATYLQLAQALGNEKAVRAVASANGANAISVIIPCHRIIGSDGRLVGYAGGLQTKQQLLRLESEHYSDGSSGRESAVNAAHPTQGRLVFSGE